MKQFRITTVIATGLLALCAFAPVRAQSTVTIGYIDMEAIFNQSEARKAGEDKVNNLARTLSQREQTLQDAKLLAPATWQKYKLLLEKDKPTADDQKQLTDIQSQLTALDTELKGLQQPAGGQLTDAQRGRLNELNGNGTANLGNLQTVDTDYGNQLAKLQSDLRDAIVKTIQTAAQKVASDKKVAVILNKQVAVGDNIPQVLVVAGGVDLTDDVLKAVNGK
jgi:Skp family chaperone for outer membrane proteins